MNRDDSQVYCHETVLQLQCRHVSYIHGAPADCRLTDDDWTLITDDSTKLRTGAPSVH